MGQVFAAIGAFCFPVLSGYASYIFGAIKWVVTGVFQFIYITAIAPLYILFTVLNYLYRIITSVFTTELFAYRCIRDICWRLNLCCGPYLEYCFGKLIATGFFGRLKQLSRSLIDRVPIEEDETQTRKCFRIFWNSIIDIITCILTLCIKFSNSLSKAFKRILYQFFLLSVLWFLWYLIGLPLLTFSSSFSTAVANVGVVIDGFNAFLNLIMYFLSNSVMFTNGISPFANLFTGAAMKTLLYSLKEVIQTFDLLSDAGGAGRKLEAQVPFFQPVEESQIPFKLGETIIHSLIVIPLEFVGGILAFANLFFTVVGGIAADLIKLIASVSIGSITSIPCCFTNGPAFGCCLLNYVIGFFSAIGISFPKCKGTDLTGVNCKCDVMYGGPFATGRQCPIPRYICSSLPNGLWVETTEESGKTPFTSPPNKVKQQACRNWVKQQQRGRGLSDTECIHYCVKEEGNQWLFLKCGNDARLTSDTCNGRRLEGELWQAHLDKYKFKHPEENVSPYQPEPPPITQKEKITKEEFIRKIREIENEQSDVVDLDCRVEEGDSFEDWFYRATCIGLKLLSKQLLTVDIVKSLPVKHIMTIHRVLLHENFTFPMLLDEVADTHNEHHGRTLLYNQHQELRERFKEGTVKLSERTLQHIDKMKELRGRVLDTVPNNNKYLCPDGTTYVPLDETCTCPMPSKDEFGSIAVVLRYIAFTTTCIQYTFDPRQTLLNLVSCWQAIVDNPESDPTNLKNIPLLMFGVLDWSKMRVCFPIIPELPYPPLFGWNWRKYVEQNCETSVGPTGTMFHCICPQYDSSGVVNYGSMCATFIGQFECSRLKDTWIFFQFFITQVPFFNTFINTVWQGVWGFIRVSNEKSWLLAFDPTYAMYGMTFNSNLLCMFLNIGSPIWTTIVIILPAIIIYFNFFEGLKSFIAFIVKNIMIRPLMFFVNFIQFRQYKSKVENGEDVDPSDLIEEQIGKKKIEQSVDLTSRGVKKLAEFIKGEEV
jgi:hypothetical protein